MSLKLLLSAQPHVGSDTKGELDAVALALSTIFAETGLMLIKEKD